MFQIQYKCPIFSDDAFSWPEFIPVWTDATGTQDGLLTGEGMVVGVNNTDPAVRAPEGMFTIKIGNTAPPFKPFVQKDVAGEDCQFPFVYPYLGAKYLGAQGNHPGQTYTACTTVENRHHIFGWPLSNGASWCATKHYVGRETHNFRECGENQTQLVARCAMCYKLVHPEYTAADFKSVLDKWNDHGGGGGAHGKGIFGSPCASCGFTGNAKHGARHVLAHPLGPGYTGSDNIRAALEEIPEIVKADVVDMYVGRYQHGKLELANSWLPGEYRVTAILKDGANLRDLSFDVSNPGSSRAPNFKVWADVSLNPGEDLFFDGVPGDMLEIPRTNHGIALRVNGITAAANVDLDPGNEDLTLFTYNETVAPTIDTATLKRSGAGTSCFASTDTFYCEGLQPANGYTSAYCMTTCFSGGTWHAQCSQNGTLFVEPTNNVCSCSCGGAATEGDTLVVTGTGLGNGTVRLGSAPCITSAAQLTDTKVTCTLGAGQAGNWNVSVVSPTFGLAEIARGVSVEIEYGLSVTRISPSRGGFRGGERITISGHGFSQASNLVMVGGGECVIISALHNRIVCTTPEHLCFPLDRTFHGAAVAVPITDLPIDSTWGPLGSNHDFINTAGCKGNGVVDVTVTVTATADTHDKWNGNAVVGPAFNEHAHTITAGTFVYDWDATPSMTGVRPSRFSSAITQEVTVTGAFAAFTFASLRCQPTLEFVVRSRGSWGQAKEARPCTDLVVTSTRATCMYKALDAAQDVAEQNAFYPKLTLCDANGNQRVAHAAPAVAGVSIGLRVDSVTPHLGSVVGGTSITIHGTGFTNPDRIMVRSTLTSNYYASPNQVLLHPCAGAGLAEHNGDAQDSAIACAITASAADYIICTTEAPAAAIAHGTAAAVKVSVNGFMATGNQDCGDQGNGNTFRFTNEATPKLTSVTRESSRLDIVGAGLQGTTSIRLGSHDCKIQPPTSDNIVTCDVPEIVGGVYRIHATVGGNATNGWGLAAHPQHDGKEMALHVRVPVTITAVVPSFGSIGGGALVTITGHGFDAGPPYLGNTVHFGTAQAHVV